MLYLNTRIRRKAMKALELLTGIGGWQAMVGYHKF
jgi:hypothetical protein